MHKIPLLAATTSKLALFTALVFVPLTCLAQIECQIRVIQDGREVVPIVNLPIPILILKAAEFQLEVSPSACAPSIASIPNPEIAREIAEKRLIYGARWTQLMAASPDDGDKLLWWARTAFDPELRDPPDPRSFQGKQYLALCEELKYCPKVYPMYSSNHPFSQSQTGSKSIAVFKRLDESRSLADAKGKSLLNVIYTHWRSLPSEFPMANPEPLLFRPNIIQFVFRND